MKRYDSSFRLLLKLALEMGPRFPLVSLPDVVFVISNMNMYATSHAGNACAALVLFPTLESLRFDPAIKAMRMDWNKSTVQYASFWSGSSMISRVQLDHGGPLLGVVVEHLMDEAQHRNHFRCSGFQNDLEALQLLQSTDPQDKLLNHLKSRHLCLTETSARDRGTETSKNFLFAFGTGALTS